jgi:hypothetical protein
VEAPQLPGGIVTIGRAESSVDADFDDKTAAVQFTYGNHAENDLPARTTTSAVVHDLAVTVRGDGTERVVKAGRIEMQLVSRSPRNGEPSIQPVKAEIEGLTLDGVPLKVHLRAKMFCDHDTREKLCQAYESDDQFYSETRHMLLHPAPSTSASYERKLPAGETLLCTMVDRLEWTGQPHPDATIQGNAVYLKDFGTIYFAEIFVGKESRRLTMMRFHLGSPQGGELSVAEGDNNGQAWPP